MNFRVDGVGVDSGWISIFSMWSRREAGSRLGRGALLAAEAGHQDGGALRLAIEAWEVDRLARRGRAFAERAEADQAAGELGDPAAAGDAAAVCAAAPPPRRRRRRPAGGWRGAPWGGGGGRRSRGPPRPAPG